MTNNDKTKRLNLHIDKTKELVKEGYSASEIAKKLKLPEPIIRAYITIDEQEKMKK